MNGNGIPKFFIPRIGEAMNTLFIIICFSSKYRNLLRLLSNRIWSHVDSSLLRTSSVLFLSSLGGNNSKLCLSSSSSFRHLLGLSSSFGFVFLCFSELLLRLSSKCCFSKGLPLLIFLSLFSGCFLLGSSSNSFLVSLQSLFEVFLLQLGIS